jgi:hypothetical protein
MKLDITDVIEVVGICSLTVGLWWIYPPVALIILGLIFIVAGYALSKPPEKRRSK